LALFHACEEPLDRHDWGLARKVFAEFRGALDGLIPGLDDGDALFVMALDVQELLNRLPGEDPGPLLKRIQGRARTLAQILNRHL
jgi:hypothetical protein